MGPTENRQGPHGALSQDHIEQSAKLGARKNGATMALPIYLAYCEVTSEVRPGCP